MNNMSNPYKTREGGATVTVFVPYDCNNHCPFCINKKEYADCSGFSLDAILRSIHTMDEITPRCDFVFTGGEPLADLGSLQKMLDAIPNISTSGFYNFNNSKLHHILQKSKVY